MRIRAVYSKKHTSRYLVRVRMFASTLSLFFSEKKHFIQQTETQRKLQCLLGHCFLFFHPKERGGERGAEAAGTPPSPLSFIPPYFLSSAVIACPFILWEGRGGGKVVMSLSKKRVFSICFHLFVCSFYFMFNPLDPSWGMYVQSSRRAMGKSK